MQLIVIGGQDIFASTMHILKPVDTYFLQQTDPLKACLLALRTIILDQDSHILVTWKYGMPFYSYQGKLFCYIWTHKKYKQPYIGIVEGNKINHPLLVQEKRAKMKIILIDPQQDIPIKLVKRILKEALTLYIPSAL